MADVKYEFYDTAGSTSGGLMGNDPSYADLGQEITATSTHDVQFVKIPLNKQSGATGTLLMKMYNADGGGLPTGSPVGEGSIDVADITAVDPATPVWERIDFDSSFTMTNTQHYCLCFIGTSVDGTKYVNWPIRVFGTLYTGGEAIQRSTPGVDPWAQINPGVLSFQFEIWDGDPPASAPTPDPATFSVVPTALEGGTSITMTATTGTTADPPVSYYFAETSGNPGGADRDWDTDSSYTNTGLTGETEYTYTVQMRDASLNTGGVSGPESATTGKSSVDLAPYRTNKRTVMVGNNFVWYEDI
jgi:hypothetical protein